MALRLGLLKHAELSSRSFSGLRKLGHSAAFPVSLDSLIVQPTAPQTFVLPEVDGRPDNNNDNDNGHRIPSFSSDGSMELMTEPKKKTSRHKRGIRNGPKALKPVQVIIRCNGERGATGERSGSGSSS